MVILCVLNEGQAHALERVCGSEGALQSQSSPPSPYFWVYSLNSGPDIRQVSSCWTPAFLFAWFSHGVFEASFELAI